MKADGEVPAISRREREHGGMFPAGALNAPASCTAACGEVMLLNFRDRDDKSDQGAATEANRLEIAGTA